MRGSGPKLPGYRDNSTRPADNAEILAVGGAFADASAPPPESRPRKRPKKPRRRRKAEESIRERFFSLRHLESDQRRGEPSAEAAETCQQPKSTCQSGKHWLVAGQPRNRGRAA